MFLWKKETRECCSLLIGPLQDTITWYKIRHTGTQTAHWDIQNKEDISLRDLSRFVLDVAVRSLRPRMADFVPCDRILQRAYCVLYGNYSLGNPKDDVFQSVTQAYSEKRKIRVLPAGVEPMIFRLLLVRMPRLPLS